VCYRLVRYFSPYPSRLRQFKDSASRSWMTDLLNVASDVERLHYSTVARTVCTSCQVSDSGPQNCSQQLIFIQVGNTFLRRSLTTNASGSIWCEVASCALSRSAALGFICLELLGIWSPTFHQEYLRRYANAPPWAPLLLNLDQCHT